MLRKVSWTVVVLGLLLAISGASACIVGQESIVYTDDFVNVNLSIPVVYNFDDWLAQEQLNAGFRQEQFAFARQISAWAQKGYAASFDQEIAHFWPYEAFTDFEVASNHGELLSFVFTYYEYTGGAHGMTHQASFNWDIAASKMFTLADLNKPDSEQIIIDEINRQIMGKPQQYFADSIPVDNFNPQNFYITDEGLVIYYQLYEIACYANGIQEFIIPWHLFNEGDEKYLDSN